MDRLESAHAEKNRRFNRIKFDAQVSVDFGNGSYYDSNVDGCCITNISLTGMCIAGNLQVKLGDSGTVNVLYETGACKIIRLQVRCETVRFDKKEVGLNFTSMSFYSYMLLVTILINNSERPKFMLNEFPKVPPFEIIYRKR